MTDQVPGPPQDGLPPTRRTRLRRRLGRAGARARRTAPFVGGILAAFLAVALYGALFPGPRPLTQRDVNVSVASALASQTPPPAFSQLVYEQVQPALVLIETDSTTAKGAAEHGLGTGVVVDASGSILTALHVVDGASTIHLTFADGTKAAGTVTVRRPETDIAVLQPDNAPPGLTPATLGNPNALQVGSEAFVIGNPYGLYLSLIHI